MTVNRLARVVEFLAELEPHPVRIALQWSLLVQGAVDKAKVALKQYYPEAHTHLTLMFYLELQSSALYSPKFVITFQVDLSVPIIYSGLKMYAVVYYWY